MMFVEALYAWKEVGGGIPCPVTMLLEGEEEIGSANLQPFLAANTESLAADFALISDTNMWDIDTPGVTRRLRGMYHCEINLKGPDLDLHSGLFGGSALNPINAPTRILRYPHDEQGRIQLPDFYDWVSAVTADQQAEWQALSFEERAFLGGIGLLGPSGEAWLLALQRIWARPTADISGIWGGYTGSAARRSSRPRHRPRFRSTLYPIRTPRRCMRRSSASSPVGCHQALRSRLRPSACLPAWRSQLDTPWVKAARAALQQEYGRRPVMIGSGGSISVVDRSSAHRASIHL
jgi:hypothetical protein